MAPIYLVDFNCYKPPEHFRVQIDEAVRIQRESGGIPVGISTIPVGISNIPALSSGVQENVPEEELEFMIKVSQRSGLGPDNTYLPPSIHPRFTLQQAESIRTDLDAAADECRMVVFGAVESLLAKTGLAPGDVDILVTTCSIYCPTPSMASMVVNHFKMRTDVQSYHLGGMGCSNGVTAVNMVRDLLKAHPNSNALFVTTETTTPAYYRGRDRHRQVTNVLFRMGAAAMLISNKPTMAARAKYLLKHALRVHVGQSEDAYRAIYYGPDEQGVNGIYLGKNVVTEASRALTKAMREVAPRIITWGQACRYLVTEARRKLGSPIPPYQPVFSEGVHHFLLHAGGAKVLDGLGSALKLSEWHLQPSRAVLHDYGNVSSSTTWYTLAQIESTRGVAAGDLVLQVGVGSGIKCGVCVWKALRTVRDVHPVWEHSVSSAEREALEESLQREARWRATQQIMYGCVILAMALAMVWLLCMSLSSHLSWQPGTGNMDTQVKEL